MSDDAIVVNLLIEAREVLRDHRWSEDDDEEDENDDVIAMVAKIDTYFKEHPQ